MSTQGVPPRIAYPEMIRGELGEEKENPVQAHAKTTCLSSDTTKMVEMMEKDEKHLPHRREPDLCSFLQ